MNLILLEQDDFINDTEAVLTGRRYQHVSGILKAVKGDVLRVGLLNGKLGEAEVLEVSARQVRLSVSLKQQPPKKQDVVVLLALPRPPVFKRVLSSLTAVGVRQVVVLQTSRVEKSYWQSPALEAKAVKEQMLLGLEQAGDTVLPELWLRKRFKPFVEDELSSLMKGRLAFVAHPGMEKSSPCAVKRPFVLAVGPEGGFVPSEVEMLKTKGFKAVSLGCRPLRVEPALHMLLGRMMDF